VARVVAKTVMVCVIIEYISRESVKNARIVPVGFRGYWPIEPLPTSVSRTLEAY